VMRVRVTKGKRRGRGVSIARAHEALYDVSCRFSTSTIMTGFENPALLYNQIGRSARGFSTFEPSM